MQRNLWLLYVALAGLAWGTYVPLIFYGGGELVRTPPTQFASRLLAILCVGVAYFLIGVLYPALYLLRLPPSHRPERSATGLLFSGLAGAAGALGAICVVFATSNARKAAEAAHLADPDTYKLYIAPLIFGLAPVINTLVSILWHPRKGKPWHFGFTPPHASLWLGIVLVALGAATVLYSKELSEKPGEHTHPATTGGLTSEIRGEGREQPSLGQQVLDGYTGAHPWLLYVTLAGLCWGTYVPLIFYGGSELGGSSSSRLAAILCVGVAYFILAVLVPGVYLWMTPPEQQPNWQSPTGLTFAGLAGAAGAIGAICVIFATKSAVDAARASGRPPATYKLYIAPLIFGLAPIINTLVSILWHPQRGDPFQFALVTPHYALWLGIVLVGAGAALVLYSKELSESGPSGGPKRVPSPAGQPTASS
jgi:hypothetical protein